MNTMPTIPVLVGSSTSSLQWVGIVDGAFHTLGVVTTTPGGPLLLRSWGSNQYGQLGNGSTIYSQPSPAPLANGFGL